MAIPNTWKSTHLELDAQRQRRLAYAAERMVLRESIHQEGIRRLALMEKWRDAAVGHFPAPGARARTRIQDDFGFAAIQAQLQQVAETLLDIDSRVESADEHLREAQMRLMDVQERLDRLGEFLLKTDSEFVEQRIRNEDGTGYLDARPLQRP